MITRHPGLRTPGSRAAIAGMTRGPRCGRIRGWRGAFRPGPAAGGRRDHDGLECTMAFTEIELARMQKVVGGFCEGRTWPEIRDRLLVEGAARRQDARHLRSGSDGHQNLKPTCIGHDCGFSCDVSDDATCVSRSSSKITSMHAAVKRRRCSHANAVGNQSSLDLRMCRRQSPARRHPINVLRPSISVRLILLQSTRLTTGAPVN